MIRVIIDRTEVEAAVGRLQRILSGVNMADWLRRDVAEYLQSRVAARFERQGTEEGPWKPLAEATQRFRLYQGFSPTWPINVRFGDLRDFAEQSPGQIKVGPAMAQIVFPGQASNPLTEEKFSVAQQGKEASRGQRATPARPVAILAGGDVAAIGALLEQRLLMQMAGADFLSVSGSSL